MSGNLMLAVVVSAGSDELPRRILWEVHLGMFLGGVANRFPRELLIGLGVKMSTARHDAIDAAHG